MFKDKKIVVVMPAYNAAQTLKITYDEVMAQEIVDLVILVDDASSDETSAIAARLPKTIVHVHKKTADTAPIKRPVTRWLWKRAETLW